MRKWQIIIFISILQFSSYTVKSQLLTIGDAVAKAQHNNPKINQMQSQLKQKRAQWRTETGIGAPEISYMKEGINNKEVDPFQEQRMTISQTIDFPLTTVYRLKAIAQEVKALELDLEATQRKVKTAVKSCYTEVLYALHLQKLREEQLKLATELYNAVYTRFETGIGNGMDLTKAELQVAEANNDIDDARSLLHKARYDLFNLIGLDPENQKYSITFMDTLHSVDVNISQIQALEVITDQPAYQASEKQLLASHYFLKEAKSNFLPDIKLNVYKQDYGSGYNFNGFEVGLSFPLWFMLDQKGRINRSIAQQEEITWRQQEIKLDVKKEIEHAWHSYEVSRSIIQRYDQTIRSKSEKLNALSLAAYRLGEVDLLNLINAQQIYLNSQTRYITALRDFYIQLVHLEAFLNTDLVY